MLVYDPCIPYRKLKELISYSVLWIKIQFQNQGLGVLLYVAFQFNNGFPY